MSTELLPPTDAQIAGMRQEILTVVPLRQRRRRIRIVLVGVAGIAIAGSLTAGAIAYRTSIEALNSSFDCYTTSNLSDPHGTSGYADGSGVNTKTVDELDKRVSFALETCEAGYAAVPTVPSPNSGPFIVPNPTACLLDDGRIAVLPNKNDAGAAAFCRSVGLSAPGN